ncbi:hypothetical protein HN51_059465, partial [Arachis hypogaea]
PGDQVNRKKLVPFVMFLPILIPQLPKDRAMQLETLFSKLKMRPNQGPVGKQHPIWIPTVGLGARHLNDTHVLALLHQKV